MTEDLEKGLFSMSNKRKKYRANKKKKKMEERLERMNEYGIQDLTPFEAINQIIEKDKARGKDHEQ